MLDLYGIILLVFGYLAYRLSDGGEIWMFLMGVGTGMIGAVYTMVLNQRGKLLFLVIRNALDRRFD